MSDALPDRPTDAERVVRLERSVRWLKLGLFLLAIAVLGILFPSIGNASKLLLAVIAIAAALVVPIVAIANALDRVFRETEPKE